MRQHIEKGAVTSGRGKGKISGQKNVLESHAELLQVKRRGIQPNFFCVLTALCMNQNINPLAITSVYWKFDHLICSKDAMMHACLDKFKLCLLYISLL